MYFLEFHVEQFDFQLTFINQYKSFIWKLRALLNQTKDFIKIINKRTNYQLNKTNYQLNKIKYFNLMIIKKYIHTALVLKRLP